MAVYIATEDPSGERVEIHFDAAVIEEIEVDPWGRYVRRFVVAPCDYGSITTIRTPKHRTPKHAKEN